MSGKRANFNGGLLESALKGMAAHIGLKEINYEAWMTSTQNSSDELLLRHVPYTNKWDQEAFSEFVFVSQKYNVLTRVECKWQHVRGSIDEKYYFNYMSLLDVPEDVIMVMDGNGMRDHIRQKLREMGEQDNNKIQIMTISEFITWIIETFNPNKIDQGIQSIKHAGQGVQLSLKI